jgi:hypothetical protein
MIDLVWERKAFGPTASPVGRASFYRRFGTEYAEQRRRAWGASTSTIRSGVEPRDDAPHHGFVDVDVDEPLLALPRSNSPFDRRNVYLTEQTRANECAKFFKLYGAGPARAHCKKYGTDLNGQRR